MLGRPTTFKWPGPCRGAHAPIPVDAHVNTAIGTTASLGGSHSQIQRLRDAFNKDPLSVDLSDEDKWEDVDAIAGLAKAYIRELEEPVMTSASCE